MKNVIRWLGFLSIIAGLTVLCLMVLAPWQLGKNSAAQQRNARITRAANTAAVPVDSLPNTPENEYRLVSITGHFMPEPETIVRLRIVDNQPVVKVVAGFTADNGSKYLIYRGYVPEQHGPIAPLPQDTITIQGRLRSNEGVIPGKEHAVAKDGHWEIYSIDSSILSHEWKADFKPGYVELVSGSPGVLQSEPLPQLRNGPYLSYGIQWVAFGIVAPVAGIYLLIIKWKTRDSSENNGVPQSNKSDKKSLRAQLRAETDTPPERDNPDSHSSRYGT